MTYNVSSGTLSLYTTTTISFQLIQIFHQKLRRCKPRLQILHGE